MTIIALNDINKITDTIQSLESMEKFKNTKAAKNECMSAYFVANAYSRFAVEIKKYIWFKSGRFLNPLKKNLYINKFIQEESENFINKGEINIPFLEFSLAADRTYKCIDCNIYKPAFEFENQIQIIFFQFKEQFDAICNSITSIRNLIFTNVERNPDFLQILEYAAQSSKVHMIKIIVSERENFPTDHIDEIKKYNQKVYFHLAENSALKKLFKDSNIKYQIVSNK